MNRHFLQLSTAFVFCMLLFSCSLFQPGPAKETMTEPDTETMALKEQLDQVTTKLDILEKKMDSKNTILVAIKNRLATLETELKKSASSTAKTAQAETITVTAPSADKKPEPPKPKPPAFTEPDTLYREARELLMEQNYKKAATLFKEFSSRYPKADLADNALYWLGECHYSLNEFAKAVTVFKGLVQTYPKGGKVPDALLKTAYAYLHLEDTDRAHHYLKLVVKKYPFTPAGEIAENKLRSFQ